VLKISVIATKTQYRMVLEGKLIAPWTAELSYASEKAARELAGRELVVDVKNLTTIGEDGKAALIELMRQGARFVCCGVFTRQVLRQLARKANSKEMKG
jgi:hypothetical protein